jgi:hypothetical protein
LTNGIFGDECGVEGRERRLKEEFEVISPGPEQRTSACLCMAKRLSIVSAFRPSAFGLQPNSQMRVWRFYFR